MAGKSPTSRTLDWMRDRGYECAITERWNSYAKIRVDLFGFIDVLAVSPLWTVAVQATSGSNVSARIDKIKELESARNWLAQEGRRIWVLGWRKTGAAGKMKLWNVRIVELRLVENEWLQEELLESEVPRTASSTAAKTTSPSTTARRKARGSSSSGKGTASSSTASATSHSPPAGTRCR